jgi:hypothetical protein
MYRDAIGIFMLIRIHLIIENMQQFIELEGFRLKYKIRF